MCYLHKAIHMRQILAFLRDDSIVYASMYIIALALTPFLSVLNKLGEYQLLKSTTIYHIEIPPALIPCTSS